MAYPELPNEISWYECFVDPTVVTTAVSDPEKRKLLPKLCIQFTEKGFLAEREKDKGNLSVEDLMLFERKAASMRLCAMATFAALNYDIDFIIDNISRYELLTLRVLADNFYKIYNEQKLDATFGNWLFYRFVLSIDRRNRIPPPTPSATVPSTMTNGQLMQSDPAFLKHEKVQRMIGELREHVLKARAFITELAEEPRDVTAPGLQCFLKPFVELAPKSMTAALLGDRNVLIEAPSPDFEAEKIHLPSADVANKCLSELVQFLFTAGDLVEARKILQRVVKTTIKNEIITVDEGVFRAYSLMLSVPTPFVEGKNTAIKQFVFDQKVLSDETSEMRRSELYRYRGAAETTGQLQQVYIAENAAMSVCEGHPTAVRNHIKNPALIERFVKVLKKMLDSSRGIYKNDKKKEQMVRAHLQYLCGTVIELREMLETSGVDCSRLQKFQTSEPKREVQAAPSGEQLFSIIRGADAYWKILTEFSAPILQEACNELNIFWFPVTMQNSEFLGALLDPSQVNTPDFNRRRLLLAKLEQLKRMHNYNEFGIRLNEYYKDIETSQSRLIVTYESIQLRASIGNHRFFLPFDSEPMEVRMEQALLIFKADFVPTESCSKIINHCLALLLNGGQAQTVMHKGGHLSIDMFKCVPIARILGAYLDTITDRNSQKKCADGMWRTVTPLLMEAQPRRGRQPGSSADPAAAEARLMSARRDLSQLFHLLDLIREPKLVEFILAYVVRLHNRLMEISNKPLWTIHAKLLPIFTPDPSLPRLEFSSHDDVRQLLRTTCENAYAVSRTDPDTIRTYADFLYTEKDYQGAGQKYMEYFASVSPTFRLNSAETSIFEESLLHRLRLCLAHSGYLTMSMLTCQWMKTLRAGEYQKAMSLLRNNETRDVGANCAEFVTDVVAIELLSQHYQANRMTKSLNTLYAGASSLSANKNVPRDTVVNEVNRRTCKFLTAVASIYFGLHV